VYANVLPLFLQVWQDCQGRHDFKQQGHEIDQRPQVSFVLFFFRLSSLLAL
jgi:hypothetical protein